MKFSLVIAALLCLTTWMSAVNATHGPVASCCLGWSNTKVPLSRIQNYTIQSEGACLIKAVVFQTVSGPRICSDPDNNWAKKAMRKVDGEKKTTEMQEKQQSEEGPVSNVTAAAPTLRPSESTTKKRRSRYERRRQRIKFARKRKGQRRRL